MLYVTYYQRICKIQHYIKSANETATTKVEIFSVLFYTQTKFLDKLSLLLYFLSFKIDLGQIVCVQSI